VEGSPVGTSGLGVRVGGERSLILTTLCCPFVFPFENHPCLSSGVPIVSPCNFFVLVLAAYYNDAQYDNKETMMNLSKQSRMISVYTPCHRSPQILMANKE
jgi:hypothetical protein